MLNGGTDADRMTYIKQSSNLMSLIVGLTIWMSAMFNAIAKEPTYLFEDVEKKIFYSARPNLCEEVNTAFENMLINNYEIWLKSGRHPKFNLGRVSIHTLVKTHKPSRGYEELKNLIAFDQFHPELNKFTWHNKKPETPGRYVLEPTHIANSRFQYAYVDINNDSVKDFVVKRKMSRKATGFYLYVPDGFDYETHALNELPNFNEHHDIFHWMDINNNVNVSPDTNYFSRLIDLVSTYLWSHNGHIYIVIIIHNEYPDGGVQNERIIVADLDDNFGLANQYCYTQYGVKSIDGIIAYDKRKQIPKN